jgi:hypothetical protein
LFYEIGVDRGFTEFIFDNCDTESMVSCEDVIEECGFATSEKTSDDSYGDHRRFKIKDSKFKV